MTRIAYFPVVEREDQLTDILSRAAWFLTFSSVDRIDIPVADERLARSEWKVAQGMDPAIAQRFTQLREIAEIVPVSKPSELEQILAEASVVMRWNTDAYPPWAEPTTVEKWLESKDVLEVDPEAIRQEGSHYIDVSFRDARQRSATKRENRAKFARLSERLGQREQSYVLATGPSVGDYAQFDYEDALSIVCNSVILNEALMDHVSPEVLVFADPVFHFGPSQYAASFRDSVLKAAARSDFTICLPQKYEAVFTAALPELADRTIAIPFRKDRAFNFDLAEDFELRTTANVLTFVMLPLASTFSERVGILGCDGRPLDQNTYFWSHNRSTQINDKMANIKEVHPGFFAIDYDDYYTEHCETLEEELSAGERAGKVFTSLGFSHIPALESRMARGVKGATKPKTPGLEATSNGGAPTVAARQEASARPNSEAGWPRLLVIDPTGVDERNATGQVKRNLLRTWPDRAFMQICASHRKEKPFTILRKVDGPSAENAPRPPDQSLTGTAAREAIKEFAPDVIYYRPIIDKHPALHELAMDTESTLSAALVTHLMDDWPGRLEASDPKLAAEIDRALRQTLSRSDKVLSISARMSEVFGQRYGVELEPIANGIDVDTYRRVSAAAKPVRAQRDEVVLRYSGAIARDMTFNTLLDVAQAVDALQSEIRLRFEVYTMRSWRREFEEATEGLRGISIHDTVPDGQYPALLAEADILVLGYNFDPDTVRYVWLSLANKLPECLASGSAVLAVGPTEIAGIDYVASRKLGRVVTEPAPGKLKAAVRRLASDGEYRDRLGAKAQTWAFEHLDIADISARFESILHEAAGKADMTELLSNPLPRAADARVDETHAVAHLLADRGGAKRVLLDVGAHHGSSLAPFAKAGWTVKAFEPDPSNREMLMNRYGDMDNVTIDSRAVSNEAAEEASFFSSEESTGISALHAFRDTHEQSATVSVTTVSDVVEDHGLDHVDFLKIDVEGFDWNVLKGVPWDRIQPEVIETEFEDAKTVLLGHTYSDVADYLVGHGYAVYLSEWHPIVRYGISHQWRQLIRYPEPLASEDAWGNILAFRKDPGIDALRGAFAELVDIKNPDARLNPDEDDAGPALPRTRSTSVTPRRTASSRSPVTHSGASIAATIACVMLALGAIVAGSLADVSAGARALLWSLGGLGLAASVGAVLRRRKSQRSRSLYEGIYHAASQSPSLLSAGRLSMWLARKMRRYPLPTLVYLTLLVAAVVVGLLPALEEYAAIPLSLAALLAVVGLVVVASGYVAYLAKKSAHESQLQHDTTNIRLERAENRHQRIGERLTIAEVRQRNARQLLAKTDVRQRRTNESMHEQSSSVKAAQQASHERLEAQLADLAEEQLTMRGALRKRVAALEDGQESSVGELKSKIGALERKRAGEHGELGGRIADLDSEQKAARENLEARIRELDSRQTADRSTNEELLRETRAELQSLGRLSETVDAVGRDFAPKVAELEAAHTDARAALEARLGQVEGGLRRREEEVDSRFDALRDGLGEQESLHRELTPRLTELHNAQESMRTALEGKIIELSEGQRTTREALDTQIRDLRSDLAALDELSDAIGALDRQLTPKVTKLESDQEETRETLGAKLTELEEAQRSARGALRKRISAVEDAQEAAVETFGSQISGVEHELSGAIESLRQEMSQTLRYPTLDSRAWTQLSDAVGGRSDDDLLEVSFGGTDGLQPIAAPMLLEIEGFAGSRNVGVNRFQELSQLGKHEARWVLDSVGRVRAVGVLVALKPQGRQFVELSVHGTNKNLARARFDIEEASLLGGSGPADAAAAVEIAEGGWRLCCLRLPLPARARTLTLRLAVHDSSDFAGEYEGETGRGVLASDPVAIKG